MAGSVTLAGMATIKPITIAGGGLAGLTLGIALRRQNVPVVLHEAGSYPRHRVCGEFLSGAGAGVLESLGLGEVLDGACLQRTTAWFQGKRPVYAATLPYPAYGLSRFAMDERLRQSFQALGGTLHERSRLRPDTAEGFVWSGGRVPVRGPWIGLKCHVPGLALSADLEMHLGSNGYVGLARVENDCVNVCGLFRCDSSVPGRVTDYLRAGGMGELADRIEAAGPDPESFSAVAGFRLGWQKELPGVLAVGDANGLIPPFAGNGMSMAFEAAATAGGTLARYACGDAGWTEVCTDVKKSLRHRFSRRLLGASILHPFLTAGVGQALLVSVSRLRLLPFAMVFRVLR